LFSAGIVEILLPAAGDHFEVEMEGLMERTNEKSPVGQKGEMVQRLLSDNWSKAEHQRAVIAGCDRYRDSATSNLLQGLLDEIERRIWFLYELTQGKDLD
jgi:DNA-binding ferritin-like protein